MQPLHMWHKLAYAQARLGKQTHSLVVQSDNMCKFSSIFKIRPELPSMREYTTHAPQPSYMVQAWQSDLGREALAGVEAAAA